MNLTEPSLNCSWSHLKASSPLTLHSAPRLKYLKYWKLSQRVINSSVGDSKSKIRASMGFGGLLKGNGERVTQDRAGKSKFLGEGVS